MIPSIQFIGYAKKVLYTLLESTIGGSDQIIIKLKSNSK